MKNYHYPLILGSTAFLVLATQQLPSVAEDYTKSNQIDPPVTQTTLKTSDSLDLPSLGAIDTIGQDLNSSLNFTLPSGDSEIKDLLAQNAPLVPQPEVIIQDNNPTLQPNTPSEPVLPRAVAPPVGDIAVSNIDASGETIDLGTSAIVPRLVLREAPVREVLTVLARYAGFNVVFLDEPAAAEGQKTGGQQNISLDLENETVQDVFNSVLMVSGLKANRRGRTIFVGSKLPTAARNLVSRTLRLNQIKVDAAAKYLASQGAEGQVLVTTQEDIVDPLTNRVVGRRDKPPELQPITAQKGQGSQAAYVLDGLTITIDDRLNTITLVGEPRKVEIATSMLVQLDARRRQVAVNVKVIDVNLTGTEAYNSSFSFGFNDGFFVQDAGAAYLNFGGYNPATKAQAVSSVFTPPIIPLQGAIGNSSPLPTVFFDQQNAPFGNFLNREQFPYARPSFGPFNNPLQPGVDKITPGTNGQPDTITYTLPNLFQYPNKFLLSLQANITSGNAKVLTDPTLVVQEGQQATVKLVQKVLTSVKTEYVQVGTATVPNITPVFEDAGLTLSVTIDKIDDNGYISLFVSPTIAAPGSPITFNSGGVNSSNQLFPLNKREVTSGLIRLRDGQTLILSGVISETQQTTVSKVPILGDIPILGALFRKTDNQGNRSEVIVLLTPKIIEDNPDSTFGYNYTPGKEAAEVLRRQGFPVPTR